MASLEEEICEEAEDDELDSLSDIELLTEDDELEESDDEESWLEDETRLGLLPVLHPENVALAKISIDNIMVCLFFIFALILSLIRHFADLAHKSLDNHAGSHRL